MKRIVTSTYRYKRPPRKRKAQAVAVPQAVVKASKPKQRRVPPNDDRKSSIVTVRKRGRRFADVPDMTPEEHRRVGDLADALWRDMVRRITDKDQQ
jgi:hypothetical protein